VYEMKKSERAIHRFNERFNEAKYAWLFSGVSEAVTTMDTPNQI